MADVIRIKKGLNINLVGAAKEIFSDTVLTNRYSIRPDDFPGITPRLDVKQGTTVKIGTSLFHDKNNPEIKFVSPVSGVVDAINRGERRKILDIQISSDEKKESVEFPKCDINTTSKEELKSIFMNFGFWTMIRKRPFDIIAEPTDTPKSIFISAFDSAPLAPNYNFLFAGMEKEFQKGIDVLKAMVGVPIHVCINDDSSIFSKIGNVNLHIVKGPHPAGNVGVQINKISPINKGDVVWTLSTQNVITIGRSFINGAIDFCRNIALTGSMVKSPCYFHFTYGASIKDILKDNIIEDKKSRFISGNALTGTQILSDGFIGAFDNQITVLPEASNPEFLGWIMPRFNKFSISHTYFSWLFGKKKQYDIDTNINGGERAIILSNEYDKVFPMDIYPSYLIKAIISKNIDRMIDLGIYEVAPEDFSLCEFIDASKLPLQKIVREGLDYLRKEDA